MALFFVSQDANSAQMPEGRDSKIPKIYKAGLPDVPGVMFLKNDGTPGGFAPEILNNAARDEGFELEWIFAPWPELFEKLKNGEIDVLPGVTVTPQRMEFFDFLENNLYVTWSELFIKDDDIFRSITDIAGKRIGLVDKDYNSEGFVKYIKGFGISYTPVTFASHKDAVEALRKKDVYAIVGPMSRVMSKNYPGLKNTGLFFNPSDSNIAFPKKRNSSFRMALDRRVGIYKKTPDSLFVKLFNEYGLADLKRERIYIPEWLKYLLFFAVFSAGVALLFNYLLRHQVRRKKIELLRSEGKLNYAAELARLGYWEMDHSTGVTTWSPHLRQILEVDSSDKDRKENEVLDTIHPEDREMVLASFNESLRPGGKYEVQHRVVTGKGNVIWLDEIGHTEFSPSGDPVYTFGVSIDVTEKLKVLEEVKKSQERFRAIFDGIDEAVMLHDPETLRIIHANMAAFRMYGYEADELSGLTIMGLSNEEFSDEKLNGIIDTAREEQGCLFEWIGKKKDNSSFPVEIALRMVDTHEGRIFISVTRDITKRKKTEEELKAKEEMLRHAHKMEAIGQLAGGVAHDFNNMLFGIMGYAEIIQRKTENSDLLSYSRQIVDISQRAADLTKQLLSFARKGSEYRIPVDVHGSIESAYSILSRTVDRAIVMGKSLSAGKSYVVGDHSQLQSAFLNLCLNARDAMPDGGVIEISTDDFYVDEEKGREISLNPGIYILIKVSDTGKGIPKEYLPRIFDPFFTTKELGQGTGLGLAAVYGTITSHGGMIMVRSIEGEGTLFEILLPVSEKGFVKKENVNLSLPKFSDGSGKTVLVADDEPAIRDMARIILTEAGYEVLSAENGIKAAQLYAERHDVIDLVILDVIMPEMGGCEVFEKIKAINPDAKVMVLSGFAGEDKIGYFHAKDIQAVIRKPCTFSQLAEAISSALAPKPSI